MELAVVRESERVDHQEQTGDLLGRSLATDRAGHHSAGIQLSGRSREAFRRVRPNHNRGQNDGMRPTIVAFLLVAAACTSQADTAPPSTLPEVPETSTTLAPAGDLGLVDLETCDGDAAPGLRAIEVAMREVSDRPLAEVVGGAWNELVAGNPEYQTARAELDERGVTCESAEIVSIRVVELADTITPATAAEAVVWVESIGPTAAIASQVPPAEAQNYVAAVTATGADWPPAGDYAGATTCAAVSQQAQDTARGYLAVWEGHNPLDAAADPPPVEYALDVQAGRLRAAELGCDPSDHAVAVFTALTTTATDSFVSRGLRVTYASWILATMLADASSTDPVVAHVVADPATAGLAGISLVNRSDEAQTGVSLELNGEVVVQALELAPGETRWVQAGRDTLDSLTVDWDR